MLRQWWKRHTDDADEGAATAEFAVVLPCVAAVAILVLCLGACVRGVYELPGCGGGRCQGFRG